jgi:hypothetical protein
MYSPAGRKRRLASSQDDLFIITCSPEYDLFFIFNYVPPTDQKQNKWLFLAVGAARQGWREGTTQAPFACGNKVSTKFDELDRMIAIRYTALRFGHPGPIAIGNCELTMIRANNCRLSWSSLRSCILSGSF